MSSLTVDVFSPQQLHRIATRNMSPKAVLNVIECVEHVQVEPREEPGLASNTASAEEIYGGRCGFNLLNIPITKKESGTV